MRLRKLPLFIAALFMAPGAPVHARTHAHAKAQPQVQVQRQAAPSAPLIHAQPALWVVKDDDTTIYLFGTIHLLKPDITWFEGPVRTAYDASQQVVVEVADAGDPALQSRMLQRVFDPSGPTVTSQLPEDLRPLYMQTMNDYGAAALLDHVKPWYSAVALSLLPLSRLGYDPQSGADRVIIAAARKDGKNLTGLETADEQLDMFDQLPHDLQVALLVETLQEHTAMRVTIEKMIDSWTKGDPVDLADDLNKSMDDDPALKQRLILDRNARWAEWIKARMAQPGTVFVAVGAGHLAGAGSVQDVLAKLGIASAMVNTH